ncbi:hypothetical protein BDN70DRAFT_787304, partial [Pholiota conissans]
VFSSSKETDTNRRSKLTSYKIDELQILKFGYRKERLTFTEGLLCSEQELSVLHVFPATVKDLMSHGAIEELDRLINES